MTLVDLSSSLLALAHTRAAALPPSARPARILQGDATDLPHTVSPLADEVGTFDAVLLLGPLYHIMTPELRAAALAQAWDMVRPGSVENESEGKGGSCTAHTGGGGDDDKDGHAATARVDALRVRRGDRRRVVWAQDAVQGRVGRAFDTQAGAMASAGAR